MYSICNILWQHGWQVSFLNVWYTCTLTNKIKSLPTSDSWPQNPKLPLTHWAAEPLLPAPTWRASPWFWGWKSIHMWVLWSWSCRADTRRCSWSPGGHWAQLGLRWLAWRASVPLDGLQWSPQPECPTLHLWKDRKWRGEGKMGLPCLKTGTFKH